MSPTHPATAEVGTHTVPGLLLRNAREYPDHAALSWQAGGDADWTTLTWSQARDRILALAQGYARLASIPVTTSCS